MATQLMKGNDAVVIGALAAGCRAYFGYPITPASEIAHAAARYFPAIGGVFIQAESEVAAINMVYGTAGTGVRVMTASSSPGFSLKQEGISYCAGAELPCVVIDVNRGGPGLGNIAPEQSDYFQVVKGGGHGSYHLITLAPNSAQEMCDLTMLAFDLADQYRTPACLLADGVVGQMMEAVDVPKAKAIEFDHSTWAVQGDAETRKNLITSIYLEPDKFEAHNLRLNAKFKTIEANEVRYEAYQTDDADLIVVAYGVVSRLVSSVVDDLRAEGKKVGMLRPITLWPFPKDVLNHLADTAKNFISVELNCGQMVEDVRLAVNGKAPVHFYGRCGGNIPTGAELEAVFRQYL